jgi:hypothetical protein
VLEAMQRGVDVRQCSLRGSPDSGRDLHARLVGRRRRAGGFDSEFAELVYAELALLFESNDG